MVIQGLWRPAPPGKEQSHELQAEEVTVVGTADSEVSLPVRWCICSLPSI